MKNALTNIIQNEHLNEYPLFEKYCHLKEGGLRKESFKSLNSFIEEAKAWNTKKQQNFALWLFNLFETSENIHHVLVYPLEENLLKPLLEKWMIINPKDPKPYRWYGLFLNTDKKIKYLEIALKLGGTQEQQALLKIIDFYFNSLWYSFHHISEDLYLGDLDEDKHLIEKIENLNTEIKIEQCRIDIYEDLIYYRNLLNDWVEFENVASEGFVKWCANNGKKYDWIDSYYYD